MRHGAILPHRGVTARRLLASLPTVEGDAVAAALERAESLSDVGRDRAALDLLLPLLARDPDHPLLVVECARLLMSSGTQDGLDEGLRLARRAVALDPQDADALAVLGLGLTTNPLRWREARRATEQAVALAPHDPAVWLARAQVLKDTVGARGSARAAAERAVQLAPEDAGAALLLAQVAFDELNPFDRRAAAEVDALVARALALDPASADAHVLRAEADLDGTSGERQAAYLEAARLDPTHREALAGVDDELTFPLRLGFWLMWLLVVVQAVLLVLGVDWGLVLGVVALALVLPLAWVGFLVVRREATPDPARRGFDGLLLGFGVCLFLSVPFFRLSTRDTLPWVGLVGCVLVLVVADVLYRTRRSRRLRRLGA